jgi:S-adenosylmethionine hydrolase
MRFSYLSLTSDFGVQTQGVGLMEGVARSISPATHVLHLMHGLPAFDIIAAARTLESIQYLPIGVHVCVCDPGVGSARKAVIIDTQRGDCLVGPDNGVLIPASRLLGGAVRAHEITNERYMRHPVSPIFHGRDIFVPAAAHLNNGIPITAFGPMLEVKDLVATPYGEAVIFGSRIMCRVIQINRFGSIHLNISHSAWDELGVSFGAELLFVTQKSGIVYLPFVRTFSDVPAKQPLLLKDDYGRIEIAMNMDSFVERCHVDIGEEAVLDIGVSGRSI